MSDSTPSTESILEEAQRLVHGPRQQDYGHPFDDFTRTGKLWAAILGLDSVTPEQVALCMCALKISRQCHAPKRDNLVDLAGYAATIELIEEWEASRCRVPLDPILGVARAAPGYVFG